MIERSPFAAVADARRRELVECLALLGEEGMQAASVTELALRTSMERSTVSRHVALMRESGLLSEVREGTSRLHTLRISSLYALEDWVVPIVARLEATSGAQGTHSLPQPAEH